MRGKIVLAGLILSLSGLVTSAQSQSTAAPTEGDLYCTGTITKESVPQDSYVITGEGSNYKMTFQEGDYIYLNKGASQGVKVGDEFSVIRPVNDPTEIEWSKWQFPIIRKLGTWWEDEGRVRVVVAQPDTAVAQVEHSCNWVQRGDIILPYKERPAPPLKAENNFDRFAPFSGKATAMVMIGKLFVEQMGTNDIFFVNLGSEQGVKVGDYFRIFRYTGTQHETAYQTRRFAFDADKEATIYGRVYGFGSVPEKYKWDNTPREVIGEGIVLRTGTNSATVLATYTLREFYIGDYVELE
ncbi:MAG: hypothetical protein WCA91_23415 [Candidatus Acidiferrales bacterium]